jgi:hypothetical protein
MSSLTSGAVSKRPLSPFAVPECAACIAERCHTNEERRKYHPLSGHGFTKEGGWTDPRAKSRHDAEVATANAMNASIKTTPEAN